MKMLTGRSIIWRRLDHPGHEYARLSPTESRQHLAGSAIFLHDHKPCRLDYSLDCDSRWHTMAGKIDGWVGNKVVEIDISVDAGQRWRLNGMEFSEVAGCIDLDLNFSPVTNLLPIRRLALDVGQEAQVRAAWLRFPSFKLEALEQIYRRTGTSTYRYESAGGKFIADLKVDELGFVTHYPDFWRVEGS
jgi:hypothetical protein